MAGGNGCRFRGCLVVGSVLWESSDTVGNHILSCCLLLSPDRMVFEAVMTVSKRLQRKLWLSRQIDQRKRKD